MALASDALFNANENGEDGMKRHGKEVKALVSDRRSINLNVNGKPYKLAVGNVYGAVAPSDTLLHTIRETLGLKGTKEGCDQGGCGACTVIMDGKPILSCMTLTVECDGKSVVTIEGLEDRETGKLHPLQQAFIDNTAFQCGFCTPGIIMSATALLDNNPTPTEDDIKQALAGHYCRCISHYEVVQAVSSIVGKGDENG
jgi:aerobic-type carbon monoxide dehydrogenase small subunit (CoxS/CutS family)